MKLSARQLALVPASWVFLGLVVVPLAGCETLAKFTGTGRAGTGGAGIRIE